MSRDEERAREEFTSEAEELLDTLSRDLGELEAQGKDVRPDVINKIFREVHSLKGLAGMLGFAEIADLSHNLEDMLDRLRMGKIEINRALIDLLFDSVDGLNRLVIALAEPEIGQLVDVAKLTSRIHQTTSQQAQAVESSALDGLDLDDQTKRSLTEYEEHRLVTNVRSGRAIYSVEVTFDFSDFDERLRALTTALAENGEVVSTLPVIDSAGGSGIAFRLLFASELGMEQVQVLAGEGARLTQLKGKPAADVVAEGGGEEELSLRSVSRTVRVDIGKLDHVMNIVGELIIERTHLEMLAARTAGTVGKQVSQELNRIARNIERKLNDLQKSVIEVRMVPVGQVYSKLTRTVRKVARELGKEIELSMHGEDTELDKMMIEELTDPLMHIIRNAIDHGIEPAEERVAAGKPPTGRITLDAYQKGNSVVIDVSDDGGGIDVERVRRVAVSRGLISPNETIDDLRAHELLFTPGFSTAAAVSEISGRGVGLDVVRKNIQELKGTIDLLSTPGEGTTFRISLPITLAIIQALIVRSGGETFAIPLTSVDESLRIYTRDIATIEGKEVYSLRDFTLPLLRLSDAFAMGETRDTSHPDTKWFVVVARAGERLVGILVDSLVRQQEVVIKSIGERLKSIPGIAGATELGENEIVLVVDAGSLVDRFGMAARMLRRDRAAGELTVH